LLRRFSVEEGFFRRGEPFVIEIVLP